MSAVSRHYVLAAGGTGGHLIPAFALARELEQRGHHVALITDARFSGVSTGACIGHVGPEALEGGPIGKLRDGDIIHIEVDTRNLTGRLDFLGEAGQTLTPEAATERLHARPSHPGLAPDPQLPDDTRLWAMLQRVSGGTWAGCVYDVDAIVRTLQAGIDVEHAAELTGGDL